MINENALAVYKHKPALVKENTHDKITILLQDGEQIKVREKDIEVIHPHVKNGEWGKSEIKNEEWGIGNSLRETWELLLADETSVSLQELAELVFGKYSPASAWAAYSILLDGLYFTGTIAVIQARQREQVEADEKKRAEKQQANNERELFLERLRKRRLNLPDDSRFMQDAEALAFGKTSKSRTMKDIDLGETPEDAHALLLETGFWNEQVNPHPVRFGVSLLPAKHIPGPPPPENRHDLTRLEAFAIDSPWSHDPDDAVSIEINDDKQILYVHVADPAAVIGMDSPIEQEASDRGATLYLPEGSFRMIAEEALPVFALGLAETSPVLTFKMTLNNTGEIDETEVFPSIVKVSRLTYKDADALLDSVSLSESALRSLYALAERNISRRSAAGAIHIDMPEVHISLEQGQVQIEPIIRYRSADMVRECMLLAGEGAGKWAMQRNVPIPYIEQETEGLPGTMPSAKAAGIAASYQLRRCMRPRVLSTKPGRHSGLGLDTYSQVTSPLRRYTDLIAHIQIRSFLRGEKTLPADELITRIAAGEAAGSAVNHAERASRSHWIMTYLADKKNRAADQIWEAIALEKKDSRHAARWAVIIPALALETQVPLRKDIAPNDTLKLLLKSVNIPRGEAIFIVEE